MASIPAQFDEPGLSQQLISARKLSDSLSSTQKLVSGIDKLDALFSSVKPGDIIEWGIPPGLNGRLIPLLVFKTGCANQCVDLSSSWSGHICLKLG